VLFSERELCILFWQNEALKDRLQKLVLETYKDKTIVPSQADLVDWIAHESTGSVITLMLSHIGKGIPRKKARGFVRSASVMDIEKMRSHLQNIQRPDFDPKTYKDKGYVLHGSIRTDGFRLQLLAYKLKELKSVRYKRLRADVLPLRINSTTGGVDYFLTEIRNVVKTPQDVANLWECEPDDIKILGIDLGQACVVGASAILPRTRSKMKTPHPDAKMEGGNTSTESLIFRNLAVKQKAVYQPNFKHRRWMETEKNKDPGNGLKTIQDIETELPRLHGEGASLAAYLDKYNEVKEQLSDFYNGSNNRFKKHKWDVRRAKEEEYRLITDRLLGMVGGSIGAKRHRDNKVVIGVGLGKFSSNSRLSSLHDSFLSYFVQKVYVALF